MCKPPIDATSTQFESASNLSNMPEPGAFADAVARGRQSASHQGDPGEPSIDSSELLDNIASQVCCKHRMPSWQPTDGPGVALPSLAHVVRILGCLEEVLFPCYRSRPCLSDDDAGSVVRANIRWLHGALVEQIGLALPFRWLGDYARARGVEASRDPEGETLCLVDAFLQTVAEIRDRLTTDVDAAYEGDPAAMSYAEVILSYPGLRAITVHRIAHEMYRLDIPLLPRMMSEYVHASTGIDIHPGARIGHHFFIDHGTGVVIGETTEIGHHVKLYQGVTLGARSFEVDQSGALVKGIKRHPTLGNHVVVYSGATILGGDVTIGDHSIIGGNVWLTESVEPYSTVFQEHHRLTRVKTRKSQTGE